MGVLNAPKREGHGLPGFKDRRFKTEKHRKFGSKEGKLDRKKKRRGDCVSLKTKEEGQKK